MYKMCYLYYLYVSKQEANHKTYCLFHHFYKLTGTWRPSKAKFTCPFGRVAVLWHFEFYILKYVYDILKCNLIGFQFLDELGNCKQKTFTFQNVNFLHFTAPDPEVVVIYVDLKLHQVSLNSNEKQGRWIRPKKNFCASSELVSCTLINSSEFLN